MTKKIAKNFTYDGLGFPIELHDIEMVMLNGEYHPKIDVKKVSDLAIKSLISQKSRLTGNQIKFIRSYFSMSLREFSKVVNESHMAVKKWEDFENKQTNMDKNIEIVLRLNIYNKISMKNKNVGNIKSGFYNQFVALTNIFSNQ